MPAETAALPAAETPRADATPQITAPSSAPAAPALTREAVTAQLLAIVAERTGYPPEMLGLDLDLEADLGIDSIKRVEILGAFRKRMGTRAGEREPAMEELSGTKTLRGIIDAVLEHAASAASPAPPSDVVALARNDVVAPNVGVGVATTGAPTSTGADIAWTAVTGTAGVYPGVVTAPGAPLR